jgi:site-specific DNA-cytosine methylase
MTSVAKQIGNAVPPLLAQRIAEGLAESFRATNEPAEDLVLEQVA